MKSVCDGWLHCVQVVDSRNDKTHEIVYFQLRYLSLLPLQPIKYALDLEGWAVGVAALWGHYPKVLTLKTALFRHFQLRSPKLVDLKLANNLQTVSKRYHGCQGVA